MGIIVRKNGGELEAVNGHRRLETQLQLFGEATVELDGETIVVVKDENGQLVEQDKQG